MARIYATNAIRKRNEALNYLRMSAKFDMVASQVNSAVTTGMVSATMSNVVKGLEKAVQSDNVEKVWLGGLLACWLPPGLTLVLLLSSPSPLSRRCLL